MPTDIWSEDLDIVYREFLQALLEFQGQHPLEWSLKLWVYILGCG